VQSLRQAFHAAAFARLDVQQQMPAGALHEASARQAQQKFRGRKFAGSLILYIAGCNGQNRNFVLLHRYLAAFELGRAQQRTAGIT
jgi:hypothetical protein